MEKIDCVIYSRCSTLEQDTMSQTTDLKAFAKKEGYNVVKIFAENVSGYDTTIERLQYEAMKEFVIKNKIKEILIWEISRLGRNTLQTLKKIDELKKEGINIHFKKEGINTNSESVNDKLFLQMFAAFAELERSSIIERTKRGLNLALHKKNNVMFLSTPNLGYKNVNKTLVIDENEADTVKLIFKMYNKNVGIYKICKYLTNNDFKTKKGYSNWQLSEVRRILKNEMYIGQRKVKDKLIVCPQIIDNETFERVQEKFKEKNGYRIKRVENEEKFLLKGKVRCGYCNHISGSYVSNSTHKYDGYICHNRFFASTKCNNSIINSQLLDNSVYDSLLSNKDVLTNELNNNNSEKTVEEKNKLIESNKKEIDNLNKKLKKVVNLYLRNTIEKKDYANEEKKIKKEINNFERENKNTVNELALLENNKKDVYNLLADLKVTDNFQVKKEIIDKYLKNVFVYKIKDVNTRFVQTKGKENSFFIEVVLFNNFKIDYVVTNLSKQVIFNKNLLFDKETYTLTYKDEFEFQNIESINQLIY